MSTRSKSPGRQLLAFRRLIFFWPVALACLRVTVCRAGESDPEPVRPSFLFILTDDQSWEALGCTGGEVQTPHLDRLAARGTLFTHGYNMGSWTGAVCVASRTMLLTGRSLWHGRDLERAATATPPTARVPVWSQHLRAAGYRTYFAGKWHINTHEVRDVFDVVGTVRPGMPADAPEGYNRPDAAGASAWLSWDQARGGHWAGGRHWSEALADEGLGFLREAATRPEPFFIYLAFSAPHDPRQSPRDYLERYPLDQVKVPRNFLPDYPHRAQIGLPDTQRDERLAPHPRTELAIKVHRQEYYASITHLDAQIGRVLDALDVSGLAASTCVIFTSDHGLAVGHHGFMGKQNMYEHSLRAPIIVASPGLPTGRRVEARVYLQDLMPTTLALAKASIPKEVEFSSLLPLLRGETARGRDRIYGAYFNFQRAVIEDGWKLIFYPSAGVSRLYHLATDPDEMRDLAADPGQNKRLAALRRALAAEMQAYTDPMRLPQPPP